MWVAGADKSAPASLKMKCAISWEGQKVASGSRVFLGTTPRAIRCAPLSFMRHVPKEYVGRASNTLFLGPAIGGIVLQTAGSSALFFANAGIILSMVLFFSLVKGVSLTSSR